MRRGVPWLDLEWLNPAEMFGDSMTEHSYVECTASCLAALAACREHFPQITDQAVMSAMSRAEAWLRRTQASDGSWRGVWGVQFIYGTFFGIRGLLAAGAHPGDPALRLACRWLLDRQRSDGGWGEHHSGCMTGRYVQHEESQVIQTAWALIALLEAENSNWTAIARGRPVLARDPGRGWDMAQARHGRGLFPHRTVGLRPVSTVFSPTRARSLRAAAPGPAESDNPRLLDRSRNRLKPNLLRSPLRAARGLRNLSCIFMLFSTASSAVLAGPVASPPKNP